MGIAELKGGLERLVRRGGGTLDPKLTRVAEPGIGPGRASSEGTVARVRDASAGRLDMRLGSCFFGSVSVVSQGIQAGQAGPGRQEDRQQEGGLGLELSEHQKIITGLSS